MGTVALALVMPAVASATFPGENGRILFISDNDQPALPLGLSGLDRNASRWSAPDYGVGEYSS